MALRRRRGFLDPVSKRRLVLLAQNTHALLSATLSAAGVAMLLYLLLHWPDIASAHSRAMALLEADTANQDRIYCEKWGLKAGTHEHTICTLDLKQLRGDYERRLADDVAGVL